MKNILSQSEQELINKFDSELLGLLRADLKQYREKRQTNLIDFTTRRYDLELLSILKQEISAFRSLGNATLAKVV
ncbi:hypothetical protein [Pseudopedobacter sp.]|uniref:hypothetical protein n=1 Tax=Pseudopedobacter sp. TaxID=1936787 RepID=UPI003340A944